MSGLSALIASATEIICAVGARDRLIGRSHQCDFPPDVPRLPSLTEPKFPVTGTIYDIDARVKAILQEGLSVYRVDAEKLQALRPDIIVTQDHCEVCAVSLKDVEAALAAWSGQRVAIVSLKPGSFTPNYSLPAMRGKLGCAIQPSQKQTNRAVAPHPPETSTDGNS